MDSGQYDHLIHWNLLKHYLVPERKLGFFVKIKEDENFNHPDEKRIGAGIHTLDISRINPPKFGGGLKFNRKITDRKIKGKTVMGVVQGGVEIKTVGKR
ncbi:MAG: hypothetical protein SRB2_00308 [Desulfobacteraceae bacterium Eth-SRB2]|nr:MAG: hypothetical protein SRB2_00308 [Desulfobacteraceae bacterium Eth-SRB2]